MGNEGYKKIIDEQSSIYDKERVKNYFLKTSRIYKKLIPKGKKVLEVGSGTGHYVIDLIKHNRPSVGIDYSKKMVEISKKNAAKKGIKCQFLYADAEKVLPLKKEFDFALLIGNWEYFDHPVTVLKNIDKTLNKNGKIIISTLNIFSWPLITFLEKTGIKKLSPAFWHFNSIPSRLKKYARKAGFYIEKTFFNYYFLDKVYILKRNSDKQK